MAVKVTLANGQPMQVEPATSVTIKDGHLLAMQGLGVTAEVVAVYAPGQWKRAEVVANS